MNNSVQQINFEFEVDLKNLKNGLQHIQSSDDPACIRIKQQLGNLLLKLKDLDISFSIRGSDGQEIMSADGTEDAAKGVHNPGRNVKQKIDVEMLKNVFGSTEPEQDEENFLPETNVAEPHIHQQQEIFGTQQQLSAEGDIVFEKSGTVLQEKSEEQSRARTSRQSERGKPYLADFRLCAETCSIDHNGDPISCMQFCANIPQLDSEYGWIISSSKNLLNLWRCEPAPFHGESQPLQFAHSQMTSYSKVDLDIDASFGYVFGACTAGGQNKTDSLGVFSLQPDHLLAERGSLPLEQNFNNIQQVCSLNSLGGKLSGCVAVASGPAISIAKLGSSSKLKAKAGWIAHQNDLCTQLYLSRVQNNILISGSSAGAISMWDMRDKPDAAILNFQQHGRLSGLQELANGKIISSSFDSFIRIWDIRAPQQQPIRTLQSQAGNENMSVFKLALSPQQDMVAVATMDQVSIVGINDWNMGQVQTVFSGRNVRPLCLSWNQYLEDLYIAANDGKIRTFKTIS